MKKSEDAKDWILLARYLAGESTDLEQQKIKEKADPEFQKLMSSLEVLWQTQETERPAVDVEGLWKKTADAAGITENHRQPYPTPSPTASQKSFSFLRFPQSPLRRLVYVTVLAILVCVPLYVWKNFRTTMDRISIPETQIQTLFVSNGDQSDISLSDGTRVTLDSGSSFQYPEEFGDQAREVYLDGEALFEVPYDRKRPFVVLAQDTQIRVLGTRFNVRAWGSTRSVEVAVDQGSVSFGPERETGSPPVIISEGFVSRIDLGQPPAEPQPVDLEKYLGWLRREADFQNVQVSEILSRLERWYDIKFVLRDQSIAFERLTVFIDSRPIDEILELIAALTAQTYERTGNLVVLSPENRD